MFANVPGNTENAPRRTKGTQLEENNNENEEGAEAEAEQRNGNREVIKIKVKGGSLVNEV